jgi:hypothetical protein
VPGVHSQTDSVSLDDPVSSDPDGTIIEWPAKNKLKALLLYE